MGAVTSYLPSNPFQYPDPVNINPVPDSTISATIATANEPEFNKPLFMIDVIPDCLVGLGGKNSMPFQRFLIPVDNVDTTHRELLDTYQSVFLSRQDDSNDDVSDALYEKCDLLYKDLVSWLGGVAMSQYQVVSFTEFFSGESMFVANQGPFDVAKMYILYKF